VLVALLATAAICAQNAGVGLGLAGSSWYGPFVGQLGGSNRGRPSLPAYRCGGGGRVVGQTLLGGWRTFEDARGISSPG
jgi:hypothetical protein